MIILVSTIVVVLITLFVSWRCRGLSFRVLLEGCVTTRNEDIIALENQRPAEHGAWHTEGDDEQNMNGLRDVTEFNGIWHEEVAEVDHEQEALDPPLVVVVSKFGTRYHTSRSCQGLLHTSRPTTYAWCSRCAHGRHSVDQVIFVKNPEAVAHLEALCSNASSASRWIKCTLCRQRDRRSRLEGLRESSQ